MHFLSILPLEIRLAIYDLYLSDHQQVHDNQQPSNAHLALLGTCKQIASEAKLSAFRHYINLTHEGDITAFLSDVSAHDASQIQFADVANDGRMVEDARGSQVRRSPSTPTKAELSFHAIVSSSFPALPCPFQDGIPAEASCIRVPSGPLCSRFQ